MNQVKGIFSGVRRAMTGVATTAPSKTTKPAKPSKAVDVPKQESDGFAALLAENFSDNLTIEGSVVKGTVVAIEKDTVLVDIGLKSEGRVAMKEFIGGDASFDTSGDAKSDDSKKGNAKKNGDAAQVAIGDTVEVYVERFEDRNGQAQLSREKARREEVWIVLEDAYKKQERVTGAIVGRVKGGFTVDLSGAIAFLPGSQIDIRPVRDLDPLMHTAQPFQILKIDRKRGNIVVSRRAVLEESRAEARSELVANLSEGQVLQGVVKNLTEYGAFVDLGGVDGLLHVTDIAWRRIHNPSEVLKEGQNVEVKVIRFNPETQRISLGMKQLTEDPWDEVKNKFKPNKVIRGRVTNITDYGAFIEVSEGIEGLVHVSEMSWTKKNVHPGKIVSTSQEVDVMVLDIDMEKRRISLGLKQCVPNPWQQFAEAFKIGAETEGEIRSITEFGLFIGLNEDIDGLVHLTDISWDVAGEEAIKAYKKGDKVKAKVLDIDVEKERISLGIKQTTEDVVKTTLDNTKKGDVMTCTISKLTENGLEVMVTDKIPGFIRRADLSRDRSEQRIDRFAVGEKIDAQVIQVDTKGRKLTLSIKAREIAEEKQAMAEFGSSDSGASLGDILSPLLPKKTDKADKASKGASKTTKAKTPAKTKAAAKPEAKADAKTTTKTKTTAKTPAKTPAKTKTEADTAAKKSTTVAKTKPAVKAKKADTKAETKSDAKTESKADSKTATKSTTKSATKSATKSEAKPKKSTTAKAKADSDGKTAGDSKAG